jgi:hypothetical protein
VPPLAARAIAAQALERRAKLPPSRRGGWGRAKAKAAGITSGVERAESIARGELQPAEDLVAFFARFRGTFEDSQHRRWEDSRVQQSWDLWGGEPMWYAAAEALGRSIP